MRRAAKALRFTHCDISLSDSPVSRAYKADKDVRFITGPRVPSLAHAGAEHGEICPQRGAPELSVAIAGHFRGFQMSEECNETVLVGGAGRCCARSSDDRRPEILHRLLEAALVGSGAAAHERRHGARGCADCFFESMAVVEVVCKSCRGVLLHELLGV